MVVTIAAIYDTVTWFCTERCCRDSAVIQEYIENLGCVMCRMDELFFQRSPGHVLYALVNANTR